MRELGVPDGVDSAVPAVRLFFEGDLMPTPRDGSLSSSSDSESELNSACACVRVRLRVPVGVLFDGFEGPASAVSDGPRDVLVFRVVALVTLFLGLELGDRYSYTLSFFLNSACATESGPATVSSDMLAYKVFRKVSAAVVTRWRPGEIAHSSC